MEFTPDNLANLSAVGTILIVLLVAVLRGIPALFAYLKQKDEEHRQDIMKLLDTAREERDSFYKNLGIKLDRIHDRLDTIETSITQKHI